MEQPQFGQLAVACQQLQRCQHPLATIAGQGVMHRVTPPLEIDHGTVQHRQQPLPAGFGQRTVAVEQASEMGQIRRGLDGGKQRNHKGELSGRLAAGDGYPAEQGAVAAQQGQHVGHRHGGSLGIGTARADIQTGVAVGTERLLPMNLAFAHG